MSSLWVGLVLAVGASLALNLSYVLQHRGSAGVAAIDVRAPLATLGALLRSPWWAVGAATGVAGWALHIGALAHAPVSLVQAFVAGGLAVAVPLAAVISGERLGRGDVIAVAVLVAALGLLSLGRHGAARGHVASAAPLGAWIAGLAVVAAVLTARVEGARRAAALGLAGGLLYAAADLATKALTALPGGAGALVASPWLPVTLAASVGAFFSFQRGLQRGAAVPVIALMTAGTNAGAIVGGLAVFGDPFGRDAATVAAHAVGLVLVVVGAWRLAPLQARLAVAGAPATTHPPGAGPAAAPSGSAPRPGLDPRGGGRRRAARGAARSAAGLCGVLAALVAGLGLVYLGRRLGVFGVGPPVRGALPLQQLAGGESQPLLRVVLAWLVAGGTAAAALRRLARWPRVAAVAAPVVLGFLALVLSGAESDAVAVDESLGPHLGPQLHRPALFVAVAALAVGAALAAGAAPRAGRGRWAGVAAVLALATLAVGGFGAYAYGEAFWLYRGFPPPRDPPGTPAGRFETLRFYSPALAQERQALAYLPPGYARLAARGVRFPVLYLLHAAPGRPDTTFKSGAVNVRLDELIARRRAPRMIVVIPFGKSPRFHSDTEWADARAGRYMGFVLDTVHAVDARLATLPDRRARAIAGYSEGGYGALNVALHHLGTFAVAESWSGYFRQTPTAAFAHTSATLRRANSPIDELGARARELRREPLHALVYVGRHDDVSVAATRAFTRRLDAAGGRSTLAVYPGRHDWRLWRAHVPAALRFAGRWLETPRAGGGPAHSPAPAAGGPRAAG